MIDLCAVYRLLPLLAWLRMPHFFTHDPELLDPGPTFDVSGEELDPAQRGFTMVHNYAHYFWRPYLGHTAFALWELLLSFCYGDHDTAFPSISRLARMLTNSDHCRAVVTGRPSPRPLRSVSPSCGETPPKARGEGADPPLPITSGPFASRSEAETRESRPLGPQSCRPETGRDASQRVGVRGSAGGALSILRREHLVQVMPRGQGPTLHYTFRVLKSLPLLSPGQVQQLCPGLQRDHAAWLERYGIDPAAYHSAFGPELPADHSSTPEPPDDSSAATDHPGDSRRSTKNSPSEQDPLEKMWKAALAELCLQCPRSQIPWRLMYTRLDGLQDGVLSVRVFYAFQHSFLQHRLARIVERVLSEVTHGQVHAVRFVLDEDASGERDLVSGRNQVSGAGKKPGF